MEESEVRSSSLQVQVKSTETETNTKHSPVSMSTHDIHNMECHSTDALKIDSSPSSRKLHHPTEHNKSVLKPTTTPERKPDAPVIHLPGTPIIPSLAPTNVWQDTPSSKVEKSTSDAKVSLNQYTLTHYPDKIKMSPTNLQTTSAPIENKQTKPPIATGTPSIQAPHQSSIATSSQKQKLSYQPMSVAIPHPVKHSITLSNQKQQPVVGSNANSALKKMLTNEQEDALLSKDTPVVVVGNNRTKSSLIGQTGTVQHAQALGGWHEVLLQHGGSVVRVQRNALEVLSKLPKDVIKFQADFLTKNLRPVILGPAAKPRPSQPSLPNTTNPPSSTPHAPKLATPLDPGDTGITASSGATSSLKRPLEMAGTTNRNPSLGKGSKTGTTVLQKTDIQATNPVASAKKAIVSLPGANTPGPGPGPVKKLKTSSTGLSTNTNTNTNTTPAASSKENQLSVNIAKLQTTSLKKYKKYFKLKIDKDCTRDELVSAVQSHFAKTKVNEAEVINRFVKRISSQYPSL